MFRKRWLQWRFGFTLVELLVVIAIIGILIALLLPAVQAAREAARRSQCSNNLKQLGIALHNYHDAYQRFPAGNWTWSMSVPGNPATNTTHMRRGSPIVGLLPYLEAKTVYDQFNLKSPTFFESQYTPNGTLISRTVIPGLICPSDPRGIEGGRFAFNYAASIGPGASRYPTVIQLGYQAPSPYSSGSINGWAGWAPTPNNVNGNYFGDGGRPDGWADWYNPTGSDIAGPFAKCDWAARFGDIIDGTSNVIAMYEIRPLCSWRSGEVTDWNCWDGNYYHTTTPINFPVCTSALYNYEGQTEPVAAGWLPRNQEHVNNSIIGGGIKSKHVGGAQVLLSDGSVRFLPDTMDYDTLQRLGSRSDGRPIQLP